LGRIKPTGPQGLRDRAAEVRRFFSANLERHFRAEEEILFPAMRLAVPESADLVEQLIEQHRSMSDAARGLGDSRASAKLLFDFGDLLERHIRSEEGELFPLFEKRVPADETARLGAAIDRFLGSPAGAPDSAT
jgi:hemerythrin-like domain-containing protein